jgi:hypothetical protein
MSMAVTKEQARKLVGKKIYAMKKDGSIVSGKLVAIRGNRLVLEQPRGKKAQVKGILPLVLFDLLAIGASPYEFGPFYGGGFGYDPFFSPYGGFFW